MQRTVLQASLRRLLVILMTFSSKCSLSMTAEILMLQLFTTNLTKIAIEELEISEEVVVNYLPNNDVRKSSGSHGIRNIFMKRYAE